ncbi:MAG: hypothetical protein IJZ35_07370 [Clostridia bacterium]|nr:hypothetical protein [Clostridia bacterium]
MHKKISVGLTVTISVIVLVITAVFTTIITMTAYSKIVSDIPEREHMYDSISQIDTLVRNNYYGDVDENAVNSSIAQGYLNALDGYNEILSKEEYEQYKLENSGIDENGNAIKTVTYKKFGTSGYVKFHGFNDNTAEEFKNAYDVLMSNSVTSIILDVRNTDSINIQAAVDIIDMIVPIASDGTGAIATAKGKDGEAIKVFSSDSDSISMPIAVIVNRNTSGAGELIACDIRDFGKGSVVGETTKGNCTYQQIFELSDGGAVILTVAELIPYMSSSYNSVGVIPDYTSVQAEQTDDLNSDTQFLQAYALVMS